MKIIFAIIYITLILVGLFFSVGSYLGYARSMEACQMFPCSSEPVFPTITITIGIVLIMLGVVTMFVRNRMEGFIEYKRNPKIILSSILVLIGSWLNLAITLPQRQAVGFVSNYAIGFPFTFWVTGYLDFFMLIFLALDFIIYYVILSMIFYLYKKISSGTLHSPQLASRRI